jgi:hypothetical protein
MAFASALISVKSCAGIAAPQAYALFHGVGFAWISKAENGKAFYIGRLAR